MVTRTTKGLNTTIFGTLQDSKGAPIEACLVQLYYRDKNKNVHDTYTDKNGKWSITAPTNNWGSGWYEARYKGGGLEQQLAPLGSWETFEIPVSFAGLAVGVTYRGKWAPGIVYNGNDSLKDIVLVRGTPDKYYSATSDHTSLSTWTADSVYWKAFSNQFESVATGILLAQDAAIGRSLTLGTDELGTGNFGQLRSVGVTEVLVGNGFFLSATGAPDNEAGYFRIGTVTTGPAALQTGLYWNGPVGEFSIKSSRFELKTDGNILITDASGNTLFDSSNRFADATNITTQIFSDHATTWSRVLTAPATDTGTSFDPDEGALSGWFFCPVGIQYAYFVFSSWMRNHDNTKNVSGKVHFAIAPEILADNYDPSTTDPDMNTATSWSDEYSLPVGTGQVACFTKDTQINLPNGYTRPIQNIKKGDYVLSWNETTEQFETGIVESLIQKDSTSGIAINGSVTATEEHPFLTRRGWIKTKDLVVGDWLKKIDKEEQIIVIEPIEFVSQPVYNMSISGTPTYIANGYVVHNKLISASPAWLGPGVVKVLIPYANMRYKWRMQLEIVDNPGAAPQLAQIKVKNLDVFLSRAVGAAQNNVQKPNSTI